MGALLSHDRIKERSAAARHGGRGAAFKTGRVLPARGGEGKTEIKGSSPGPQMAVQSSVNVKRTRRTAGAPASERGLCRWPICAEMAKSPTHASPRRLISRHRSIRRRRSSCALICSGGGLCLQRGTTGTRRTEKTRPWRRETQRPFRWL